VYSRSTFESIGRSLPPRDDSLLAIMAAPEQHGSDYHALLEMQTRLQGDLKKQWKNSMWPKAFDPPRTVEQQFNNYFYQPWRTGDLQSQVRARASVALLCRAPVLALRFVRARTFRSRLTRCLCVAD
jgi:hypothetical protein